MEIGASGVLSNGASGVDLPSGTLLSRLQFFSREHYIRRAAAVELKASLAEDCQHSAVRGGCFSRDDAQPPIAGEFRGNNR